MSAATSLTAATQDSLWSSFGGCDSPVYKLKDAILVASAPATQPLARHKSAERGYRRGPEDADTTDALLLEEARRRFEAAEATREALRQSLEVERDRTKLVQRELRALAKEQTGTARAQERALSVAESRLRVQQEQLTALEEEKRELQRTLRQQQQRLDAAKAEAEKSLARERRRREELEDVKRQLLELASERERLTQGLELERSSSVRLQTQLRATKADGEEALSRAELRAETAERRLQGVESQRDELSYKLGESNQLAQLRTMRDPAPFDVAEMQKRLQAAEATKEALLRNLEQEQGSTRVLQLQLESAMKERDNVLSRDKVHESERRLAMAQKLLAAAEDARDELARLLETQQQNASQLQKKLSTAIVERDMARASCRLRQTGSAVIEVEGQVPEQNTLRQQLAQLVFERDTALEHIRRLEESRQARTSPSRSLAHQNPTGGVSQRLTELEDRHRLLEDRLQLEEPRSAGLGRTREQQDLFLALTRERDAQRLLEQNLAATSGERDQALFRQRQLSEELMAATALLEELRTRLVVAETSRNALGECMQQERGQVKDLRAQWAAEERSLRESLQQERSQVRQLLREDLDVVSAFSQHSGVRAPQEDKSYRDVQRLLAATEADLDRSNAKVQQQEQERANMERDVAELKRLLAEERQRNNAPAAATQATLGPSMEELAKQLREEKSAKETLSSELQKERSAHEALRQELEAARAENSANDQRLAETARKIDQIRKTYKAEEGVSGMSSLRGSPVSQISGFSSPRRSTGFFSFPQDMPGLPCRALLSSCGDDDLQQAEMKLKDQYREVLGMKMQRQRSRASTVAATAPSESKLAVSLEADAMVGQQFSEIWCSGADELAEGTGRG